MHQKVAQLEGLVASLVANLNTSSLDTTSRTPASELTSTPPKDLHKEFGRLSLNGSETSYVGASHWAAILDGIAELKDELADGDAPLIQDTFTTSSVLPGPALLYSNNGGITKDEALAAVPPRPVADRLIYHFFNAVYQIPVVMHSLTFLKDYEQFWKNPLDASFRWLGLLFSILSLSAHPAETSQDELVGFQLPSQVGQADPKSLTRYYRRKTAECLVSSKYTNPGPYTMETLIFYFTAENFESNDTQFDLCLICGIIIRIAMRAGYHRDPSHVPGLSPFQCEMRRRLWATIVHLDMVTSFPNGLPRMLQNIQSDTLDPKNLLDKDFGPDTVTMPESRPDSDVTAISFFRTRSMLLRALGTVEDSISSVGPKSESDIKRLEQILHDARRSIPDCFRIRPLSECLMDSPELLLQRIFLDMSFHKGLCIIHRHCLKPEQFHTPSMHSRNSCVEASLALLMHQRILWQEALPGGRFCSIKWKISSLANEYFLLATTAICLLVHRNLRDGADKDQPRQAEMINALSMSSEVWQASFNSSREARRAVNAIQFVLHEAGIPSTTSYQDFDQDSIMSSLFGSDSGFHSDVDFMDSPFNQIANQTPFTDISGTDPGMALSSFQVSRGDRPNETLGIMQTGKEEISVNLDCYGKGE